MADKQCEGGVLFDEYGLPPDDDNICAHLFWVEAAKNFMESQAYGASPETRRSKTHEPHRFLHLE